IAAGSNHFTVLLDDGSVVSWGQNTKNQTNAPGGNNYVDISADYLQNYAITDAGKVSTWGLKGYLMGTDDVGRDIFPRLLEGGRVSLSVGIIAVVIASIIGIVIGGISGYFGGKTDVFLMRVTEIFNAIPFLPFAILLSYIVGSNVTPYMRVFLMMAILGCLNWAPLARLVRGQILSVRENEYITAAKAMGVNETSIFVRHMFPNILGSVLVNITLRITVAMIYESTLSFIGFGIKEPTPSWGNMLSTSLDANAIRSYWWCWAFAAATLCLATISIYMIGDGLRDAVDPKSSER
ncbi:MAG: ABC transporter permease subunit, partial [Clostridiales bacterium]|nr:ABC transporter permease subunit [Clostridiales bacterium]